MATVGGAAAEQAKLQQLAGGQAPAKASGADLMQYALANLAEPNSAEAVIAGNSSLGNHLDGARLEQAVGQAAYDGVFAITEV